MKILTAANMQNVLHNMTIHICMERIFVDSHMSHFSIVRGVFR
jgi:hypothetical protein